LRKGSPTRKVWYYQLDPGRNMGKTNPLNDADLAEFIAAAKDQGRLAEKLERGCGGYRPRHMDLVREEPQRR
jgi:type I restriction enzyme M protein